ncbi:MAG: hypothetical protein V4501_12185 [Pseudomonadota bacterium]
MLLLFSLQALMAGVALLLLATPFVRSQQTLLAKNYVLIALATLLLSGLIYGLLRDGPGLNAWFAGGKEHYQLLETFNKLGGVDGAIMTLQKYLMAHPHDPKAWNILGKLYLTRQDEANAKLAFDQAQSLQHPG